MPWTPGLRRPEDFLRSEAKSFNTSMVAMRNIWTYGLILALLSSCNQKPEPMKIPEPVVPGDRGYVTGELIFALDKKPTPQCHASTIAETAGGLVAGWFGGTHENHPDVGIWISRHTAEGWTTPVEVARGMRNDTLYPCWNPVLFQVKEGPLLLFYKVGPDPRHWWGKMMVSRDGGVSWSPSRKLGEGRLGPLIGPVKNKPVQLKDGTIFCPSSTEREEEGGPRWRVHF